MKISESFMSIQGEGATAGVPSYFIRLQGCNLMCGGKNGDLVKQKIATWHCDSEKVWRHGRDVDNNRLVKRIQSKNQLENILDGITHLIWTGGEPMLNHHQTDIIKFLSYMDERFEGNTIYNEIETNGTIIGTGNFMKYMNQINCSPKLSNSGEPENKRIVPIAIEQINNHNNSWFKFVVTNDRDIEELTRDYVKEFDIPKTRVILMPGVNNRYQLPDMTEFVYEHAKLTGYRACTRGQILAWNRTVGV